MLPRRMEPISTANKMQTLQQSEAIGELILELSRRVDVGANTSDLKPAQWAALRFLSRAPETSRTNKAFARYHRTTTGTVTVTLKTLTEKGLIAREADPHDKRVVRFELTDAGRALLRQDPFRDLVQTVASLSQVQRDQLTDVLSTMLLEEAYE